MVVADVQDICNKHDDIRQSVHFLGLYENRTHVDEIYDHSGIIEMSCRNFKIGHQVNSPSNRRQGDMPYYMTNTLQGRNSSVYWGQPRNQGCPGVATEVISRGHFCILNCL